MSGWSPARAARPRPRSPPPAPCPDGEIADLKATLKSKLGKEPRLHAKVDPTLLGGLVVKVGSRMIDSSIRTKLTGLAAVMKG